MDKIVSGGHEIEAYIKLYLGNCSGAKGAGCTCVCQWLNNTN